MNSYARGLFQFRDSSWKTVGDHPINNMAIALKRIALQGEARAALARDDHKAHRKIVHNLRAHTERNNS